MGRAMQSDTHAGHNWPRALTRRATSAQALQVDGRGGLAEGAAGQWHPEEPKGMPKDSVGGTALKNAFLGEGRFLQDASDHTSKVQEQKAREAAADRAAAEITNLFETGSGQPIDLDFDAKVASGRIVKAESADLDAKVASGRIAKAESASRQSIFAAEQPFLKALSPSSVDTPLSIKWAAHPDKCLCGTEPPGGTPGLVIWSCDDPAQTSNMKFTLPTGEEGHGQIKWTADPTKCIYVHNGWEGNGNPVHLSQCADTPNIQRMNFTVFTPATSGRSAIAWAQVAGNQPNHCLDVQQQVNSNGSPIELWECSAGAVWEFG